MTDISSIISSLSPDDIEKLKNTARQFFGGDEEKSEKNDEPQKQSFPDIPFDPGLITGVARFSKMMNENDDRSAFLMALKPLLSDKRKKKADDAVMMLKFFRIINALQENGR